MRYARSSVNTVRSPASTARNSPLKTSGVAALRQRTEAFNRNNGHRPRIVVGKPGLDGHSNGAEVIAVSARHVGFDVIYSGIRLSVDEIVNSAVEGKRRT